MLETNTNKIYKKIKERRGERFARKLRDTQLLDVPNIEHILEFANLEDLDDLIPVIRSTYKITSVSKYNTNKDPIQLLNEAGYDAFVVETEEQKNSIKKYFRSGEELCSFNDPYRHKNFYIIHAVKHGADKIKPSDNPTREDEYGTSVISIQIAKSGGFISIKNRYNHTVDDPDSTFHNNPDNIIPGLTNSLQTYFDVDFNVSNITIPDNYINVDDQLVYYNFEQYGIYFGPTYYVKNGEITKLQTDRETMIDHMIYNDKNKTITTPIENDQTYVLFAQILNDKQFTKKTDKTTQKITLQTPSGDRIVTNDKGQIIELDLPSITEIGHNFVRHNQTLKTINLPNVTEIGHNFLEYNEALESINLPTVTKIGHNFLEHNKALKSINLPNVTEIGHNFVRHNQILKTINLPNVEKISYSFLARNAALKSINLPNVTEIGSHFLARNEALTTINLPSAVLIGDNFLGFNETLETIYLPKDTLLGKGFLDNNHIYKKLIPQFDKSEIMKKATERLNSKIELQDKEKDLFLPKPENDR